MCHPEARVLLPGGCPSVWHGEPEFQVLWGISLVDLLCPDKEDLDGISLQWGFCLRESCRTGPASPGRCCVIPAHPAAVTSHTLPLITMHRKEATFCAAL